MGENGTKLKREKLRKKKRIKLEDKRRQHFRKDGKWRDGAQSTLKSTAKRGKKAELKEKTKDKLY